LIGKPRHVAFFSQSFFIFYEFDLSEAKSIFIYFYASSPDAAACRVCLPRKYGCFMLLIDNNLLLPWNKCRIYVGDQLDRWNELKEVPRIKAHAEVAKILLDR
jgi:hypothetical protein